MDRAVEQPIAYQHEGGEMYEASTIEAAHATCPVLGKMSLEQAGLLLELQAMGKEIQAEQSTDDKVTQATESKPEFKKVANKELNVIVTPAEQNETIQSADYAVERATETVQKPAKNQNTFKSTAVPPIESSFSDSERAGQTTEVILINEVEQQVKPIEILPSLIDRHVQQEIVNESRPAASVEEIESPATQNIESISLTAAELPTEPVHFVESSEEEYVVKVAFVELPIEVVEPIDAVPELAMGTNTGADIIEKEATQIELPALNSVEVVQEIVSIDTTDVAPTPAIYGETESFELPLAHIEKNLETIVSRLELHETESVLSITETIAELPKVIQPQVAKVVTGIEVALQSLSEKFGEPLQIETAIEIPGHKVIVGLVQELIEIVQMEYQQADIEKLAQLIIENPDILKVLTGQLVPPQNYALSNLGTHEGLSQQSSSPLYATNLSANHSLLGRYALLPFANLQAA